MRVVVLEAVQSRRVEELDDCVAAAGGVLELRLEAVPEEQHQVGRLQLADIGGCGLEVVGLRAGGREVDDVDVVTPELLRGERERIEGRCDLLLAA